jgi:hypothetical protein
MKHGRIATGFFGIPGKNGGQTHVVREGKPLCGRRLHPLAEFQFCSNGINLAYTECARCKERAARILEKENTRMKGVKFPNAKISIDLDGEQSSPFFIIGETRRALKEAGAKPAEANAFNVEAMATDYNHMLDVVEKWVDVKWSGRDPRVYGDRG